MGGEQINGDKIAPEILVKCEMCEYTFEIKTTLKKHMNTKHEIHNCGKCSAQFKTLMKLLNHMAECQERNKKDKLHCSECCFSCKTKKNLKAHD